MGTWLGLPVPMLLLGSLQLFDQMWFLVLISSQTTGLERAQGKAGSPSPQHQAGLNQPQVLWSELILDFWSCLLRAGVAGKCFMASLSVWNAWEEALEKPWGFAARPQLPLSECQ